MAGNCVALMRRPLRSCRHLAAIGLIRAAHGLFVIEHERRRILHFNVTQIPNSGWRCNFVKPKVMTSRTDS